MKKFIQLPILLLFVFSNGNFAIAQSAKNSKVTNMDGLLAQREVGFEENNGQITQQNGAKRNDILFKAEAMGLTQFVRKNGISYQLIQKQENANGKEQQNIKYGLSVTKQTTSIKMYRVDINWLNCNQNYTIEKRQPLQNKKTYYNNKSISADKITTNNYGELFYKNIWNGVTLHSYSKNGVLENDWLVTKAKYYKNIRMEIKGAEVVLDASGGLIIITTLGNIREGSLKVFQGNKQLPAKWKISKKRGSSTPIYLLGFEIFNYNPDIPLIIDPPVRIWGTYYGFTNGDNAISTVVDGSNNVYMAGYTFSTSNIATTGSHQQTFGGLSDAFLVKFNSSGVRQWSTYYGGEDIDRTTACTADASGNIYLTGSTRSTSGISTAGSHQELSQGDQEAFLAKFNSSGVLQWGTYYGGPNEEQSNSCTVDNAGNVFISGYSNSTTDIATAGSHQPAKSGGFDAFIVKFNDAGVRQWASYYGGTQHDYGTCSSTDATGNIYVGGYTFSSSNISTAGAHQTALTAFGDEGFLVKFNTSGTRQWGTYYGGLNYDQIRSCATTSTGAIFITGVTESATNIATATSHQPALDGVSDAFVAKFNDAGVREWGTYYGGSSAEVGHHCSVDGAGNVLITGQTLSSNGIATPNSHQPALSGIGDAFFAKLTSIGSRTWGTYYGGDDFEEALACYADQLGNAYLAGTTLSSNGISTPGSHKPNYSGGDEAFLVKFNIADIPLPIKLISFKVEKKSNYNHLQWQTSLEVNNQFFEVERSVDGLFWSKITTINGAGNSNSIQKYHYDDYQVNLSAKNIYYRLKQVDYSGTTTYSNIVLIKNDGIQNIAMYPTPVRSNLFISGVKENKPYTITNSIGQIVMKGVYKTSAPILLNELRPGVYFISLENNPAKTIIKK